MRSRFSTKNLHPIDQARLKNIRVLEEKFPWLYAIRGFWGDCTSSLSIHVQKATREGLSKPVFVANDRESNESRDRHEYWIKISHADWLQVAVIQVIVDKDYPSLAHAIQQKLSELQKVHGGAFCLDFIVEVTLHGDPNPKTGSEDVMHFEIYRPSAKDRDLSGLIWSMTDDRT